MGRKEVSGEQDASLSRICSVKRYYESRPRLGYEERAPRPPRQATL